MSKDIHYCDKCGEMMQGTFDPQAQTLCLHCQGGAPATTSSIAKAPPSMPAMPTEEIGATMTATLDRSLEAPGNLSLNDVVQNEGLDLYSPDTVAVRKKKEDTGTRLRFAEPGSVAKPRSEPHQAATLAASASTLTGAVATPTLAIQNARNVPVVTPEGKWKLQCLHCDGRLAVPPVQRRSKLRCPRCSGEQALDPSGVLMKLKGGPKTQAVAGNPTVAHLDDSSTPAEFTPPPAQPAMTNPTTPTLAAPVNAPGDGPVDGPVDGGPAAIAAQISNSLHGPAPMAQAPVNPFPASPPPLTPSAFDLPLQSPTAPPAAEDDFVSKESEGHGSALLGSDEDYAAEQLAATLDRYRAKGKGVPVENAVMWMILTSVPSFVGLYAVSELSGPEVQQTIWSFGEGVKTAIESVYQFVGQFI